MSPFKALVREFFGQFFASESVTSDIRLRQAIIGVVAFLITPGLLLSVQMFPVFELARFRAPELILPMTRLLSSLLITFATVSIGLIGACVWDALSFDRRDAMVLGPLPVSRGTVVRAKLTALAALLLGASLCINSLSAIAFAMVANGPRDAAVRHLVAHMITTSCAALCVFSAIVILRALLGMLARGHAAAALGSVLQFGFVSALLCFFALAPSALNATPHRRGTGMTIQMTPLPTWMPSRYFLAMNERLRGTADAEMAATGRVAAVATLALAVCAVMLTIAAYRRQLQIALSPAASAGTVGGARLSRALARVLTGSNRIARATSDFVLTTIARNRAQQAPIAFNGAIGLALVIVKLVPRPADAAASAWAPATLLAIPLMLAYWGCIGLRASFFVPSELPASWTFRANAPSLTSAYAHGARAAIVALIGPPTALAALALAALVVGWVAAVVHATFVLVLIVILADCVVLTIGQVPFTRAYRPGHARLKTRWPLYLFGAYAFGDGFVRLELYCVSQPQTLASLVIVFALMVVILEWAVRRAGRNWRMEIGDDLDDDASSMTVLDLSQALQVQRRPVSSTL